MTGVLATSLRRSDPDSARGRDLWDELVAARLGDQDGRGSYIFLHLLP
jgi:hypothetical protein